MTGGYISVNHKPIKIARDFYESIQEGTWMQLIGYNIFPSILEMCGKHVFLKFDLVKAQLFVN